MKTEINGSFGLFEIEKIIRRNNFYELRFSNDNRRFAGCYLNSFIDENHNSINLMNLKIGDKIWIDISAHTADKSLFVYNMFGTKGRYHRARKLNKNRS